MRVRFFAVEGETRRLVKTVTTNLDGRTSEPLLAGDRMETGVYELEFAVAEYLGVSGGEPPFPGDVPVRFGINDPDGNYHVPLLLSPYGYTTYKGS